MELLSAILGTSPQPGFMGENVTVRGAIERDVCIGDIWRWGSARLQVSAPRGPCYKLGIRDRDLTGGVPEAD